MGRNPRDGFTLLELMMALAVIGLVLAVAVPSFNSFRLNARMTGAANDLLAALNVARSEAIKRQLPVAFCGSDDPRAEEPACDAAVTGWLVWVDRNRDGDIDAGEDVVNRHDPLSDALSVTSNFEFIAYAADGFPRGADGRDRLQPTTGILLCDERGDRPAGNQYFKRIVALSPTGRPTIVRSVAEVDSLAEPADATGDAAEIDENWQCSTGD